VRSCLQFSFHNAPALSPPSQKLTDLITKCWAPLPEARPSFQEVQLMLKEIQEELKSNSSAAEVPKEAGQSLTSRAAPPAAKPAPIVGECGLFI